MHFGFSYVGLIFLIMLFVPNFIWTKHKPKDYEKYVKNENRLLLTLERIGEVLVCAIILIFSDFNVRASLWILWLAAALILMILYEIFWIRYFRSEKTMKDFYSGILGMSLSACRCGTAHRDIRRQSVFARGGYHSRNRSYRYPPAAPEKSL